MKIDPNIIEELTGLQYAGLITPDQEVVLNQLISDGGEAYKHWEATRNRLQSKEVWSLNRQFDESASLEQAWERIGKRRRNRQLKNTYRIAAGVLLVGGLAFSALWLTKLKSLPELASGPQPVSIQLQLPNGKRIDLSSTQGQVVVAGNTTLNTAAKSLSYTTTGEPIKGIARLTVPIGKDYELQLSDGSIVWLNSATTVEFPLSFADSRRITVNGEAYIKVASDTRRPFLLELPLGGAVQVLGTEFNVNSYDSGQVKVSLVSGSVKVLSGGATKVIKPGQEAVYSQQSSIDVTVFDEDYTLSWRRGIFKFDGTSLEQICRVLPRWFGIQVVMDNQRIAGKEFTGQLDRNKPLDKQLGFFKVSEEVDYYFEDGVLHFKQALHNSSSN